MLTTVFLSTLLVLGGLGGAAASDLQVHGKSTHRAKTLLSSDDGRNVRKHPHLQTTSDKRRSLYLESLNLHVNPTTSKISLPTFIKLNPPTDKPIHLHANMPMRFGRESNPGEDKAPNSTPNMPQRFGRSGEVIQMCVECRGFRGAPKLPPRLERRSPYLSLLRTLANAQLLDTGLQWAEEFDFPVGSEEVKMQEKMLKG